MIECHNCTFYIDIRAIFKSWCDNFERIRRDSFTESYLNDLNQFRIPEKVGFEPNHRIPNRDFLSALQISQIPIPKFPNLTAEVRCDRWDTRKERLKA